MAKFPLSTIRHSAAHIMAAAVKKLYNNVKFDIGPATETGFYYDFDMPDRLTSDDLSRIEKTMKELITADIPFERFEQSRDEALKILKQDNQTYKLERLADICDEDTISFYKCGDFVDLCKGPHVERTGDIKAFKLLSVAGSYYRGKEDNPMLQRIYGTAFADEKSLKKYLRQIEEAKKRDHRKLGKELGLFTICEDIGAGLILWHPKGAMIRHIIETFWKEEHYKHGYDMLYTPHIGKYKLWETSGHLQFYKDAMYNPMDIDGTDYYVKPMNCPFHIQIYKSSLHSYKNLPLRWAELGTVYRYEKSGVLHGLLRVRGFTQDDAHIICTTEQIENEIENVLKFSLEIWQAFGFKDIKAYLATKPEKSVGEEFRWKQAMQSLKKAVEKCNLKFEEDEGGGAFYGPKIDLKIKDAIGREWQTTTIQFDFNLPEKFNMVYIGEDGQKHQPYMVHRALLGSLERFFGILIEHYAGAFPLWLSPLQIKILPISEKQNSYAETILKSLKEQGYRVEIDSRQEPLGSKIKDARHERVPYIIVIGEKEVENETLSVRSRIHGQIGQISLINFLDKLKNDIDKKI